MVYMLVPYCSCLLLVNVRFMGSKLCCPQELMLETSRQQCGSNAGTEVSPWGSCHICDVLICLKVFGSFIWLSIHSQNNVTCHPGGSCKDFFNDVFLKVQGITSLHSTVQYGSQGQPMVKEGPRRSCSSLKDSIHLVCQLTEHIQKPQEPPTYAHRR